MNLQRNIWLTKAMHLGKICALLILTPTARVGAIQLLYVVIIVIVAATHWIPFVCRPASGHAIVELIRVDHCSIRCTGCCG